MSGPLHRAGASEAQESVPFCWWIVVYSCSHIFCSASLWTFGLAPNGGVRNIAAMTTCFLQTLLYFSWVNCWAHGKVVPLLNKPSDCFPKWLYLFMVPPAMCEGQYLMLSFYYSSYDDCELVPYYGFHLQFSNAQ